MEKVQGNEFTSIAWTCPKCGSNNEIRVEDFSFGKTHKEKCECGFESEVVYRI